MLSSFKSGKIFSNSLGILLASTFVRGRTTMMLLGGELMTANQIRYWELQEQKRTNRANEGIRSRSNDIANVNAESQKRQATVSEKNAQINEFNAKTQRIDLIRKAIGDGYGIFSSTLDRISGNSGGVGQVLMKVLG